MSDIQTQDQPVQDQEVQQDANLAAYREHIATDTYEELVSSLNFFDKFFYEIERGVFDRTRIARPLPDDASPELRAMEQAVIASTRHDYRESAKQQQQCVEIEIIARMLDALKIFSPSAIVVLQDGIEQVKQQSPESVIDHRKMLRKRGKAASLAKQEAKALAESTLRAKILAEIAEEQMKAKILAELAEAPLREKVLADLAQAAQ